MTMHKALYPRYDINRQYVLRKVIRGLASIEVSVDTLIWGIVNTLKEQRKTNYSCQ